MLLQLLNAYAPEPEGVGPGSRSHPFTCPPVGQHPSVAMYQGWARGPPIAALVGGAVQLPGGVSFPILKSLTVRISLALIGSLFLVGGIAGLTLDLDPASRASPRPDQTSDNEAYEYVTSMKQMCDQAMKTMGEAAASTWCRQMIWHRQAGLKAYTRST